MSEGVDGSTLILGVIIAVLFLGLIFVASPQTEVANINENENIQDEVSPITNEDVQDMSVYTGTNLSPIPNGWSTAYTGMSWGIGGSSSVVLDSTVTYNGQSSVRLDACPDSGGQNAMREANSYYLAVSPGMHIVMKVLMKTSSSTQGGNGDPLAGARFGIDIYGADGAITGTSSPDGTPAYTIAGGWATTHTFVPWGTSTFTLKTIDFTLASLYEHSDAVVANPNYANGELAEPTAIIPWVQAVEPDDNGHAWFANIEVYRDPSITNSKTIVASAGAGAFISPSGNIQVSDHGSQTFNWYAATGYIVNQVLIDGSPYGYPEVGSYTFTDVTSDATIAVSAIPIVLSIIASAGAGCTITPSGTKQVYYGNNKTFTYSASGGNTIGEVLVDGVSVTITGSYTFTNVITNHTISVSVFPVTFEVVIASHDSNSIITPDGTVQVAAGTNQIITYSATTGYAVTSVLVDGSPVAITGTYTFTNVNGPHTISVSSTLNTVTVTSQSDIHSYITPSGVTTKNIGENQQYIYGAFIGYQISQVLVDGQPQQITGQYTFNSLDANHNITIISVLAGTTLSLSASAIFLDKVKQIEKGTYQNIFNRGVANSGVGDFTTLFRAKISQTEQQ